MNATDGVANGVGGCMCSGGVSAREDEAGEWPGAGILGRGVQSEYAVEVSQRRGEVFR